MKFGLRDEILSFTKESLRLRISIKKAQYLLQDLKSDINFFYTATENFSDFTLNLQRSRVLCVEVPSNLIMMVSSNLVKKVKNLSQKILELEELVSKYARSFNFAREHEDGRYRDNGFSFFLNLIEQYYVYFNQVARLVLNFNEINTRFKLKIFQRFQHIEPSLLQKHLDEKYFESSRDRVIETLQQIAFKIEENKKLEEEKKPVNFSEFVSFIVI